MNKHYFYIEPYVYADLIENQLILYNTINYRTSIFMFNTALSICFINRLLDDEIKRITYVLDPELGNMEIWKFIQECREWFHGDLIQSNFNKPPLIVPFASKLNFDLETICESDSWRTMNLRLSLKQIYIYYGDKHTNCMNSTLLKNGYKQIHSPFYISDGDHEKLSQAIFSFFNKQPVKELHSVQIFGNHLSAKQIQECCTFFNKSIVSYNIFINDFDASQMNNPLIRDTQNLKIVLWVDFKNNKSFFQKVFNSLPQERNKLLFKIIIEDYDDYIYADNYLNNYCPNIELIPFFSKRTTNKLFEIFINNQNDIECQKLSHREIISRLHLNHFAYGKFFILPDGGLYSNLNKEMIGNIYSDTLIELIKKELGNNNGTWRMTRGKINPCSKCIYRYLCPPITNYEHFFNIINICTYNLRLRKWD